MSEDKSWGFMQRNYNKMFSLCPFQPNLFWKKIGMRMALVRFEPGKSAVEMRRRFWSIYIFNLPVSMCVPYFNL